MKEKQINEEQHLFIPLNLSSQKMLIQIQNHKIPNLHLRLFYRIDTSLALLWTVSIWGTLVFAPLTEYVTEICDPFTPVIFPNLQSIPPLPHSGSLNTISSRTGSLLFFNHLFSLRTSAWILSIKTTVQLPVPL